MNRRCGGAQPGVKDSLVDALAERAHLAESRRRGGTGVDDPTGESLERAPADPPEIAGKDHEIDIPLEECLAHRFIDTIRIERVGVEDEVLHARRDRLRRATGAPASVVISNTTSPRSRPFSLLAARCPNVLPAPDARTANRGACCGSLPITGMMPAPTGNLLFCEVQQRAGGTSVSFRAEGRAGASVESIVCDSELYSGRPPPRQLRGIAVVSVQGVATHTKGWFPGVPRLVRLAAKFGHASEESG